MEKIKIQCIFNCMELVWTSSEISLASAPLSLLLMTLIKFAWANRTHYEKWLASRTTEKDITLDAREETDRIVWKLSAHWGNIRNNKINMKCGKFELASVSTWLLFFYRCPYQNKFIKSFLKCSMLIKCSTKNAVHLYQPLHSYGASGTHLDF